jgi:AraC-like DNA-binding protein
MASRAGMEKLEAHLHGQAFAPHRHDSYAIGLTLAGVQRFRFRGVAWQCLPGQCHILHPDETHDGAAGTEAGFAYRIVYLDPALVQDALGGQKLPFVGEPVIDAARLPAAPRLALWDFDSDADELSDMDTVSAAVHLLVTAAGKSVPTRRLSMQGLTRARARIAAAPAIRCGAVELERVSGLDRWTLARQFRAAFGTSPSRFRTLRQLDLVRQALRGGVSLSTAALDAGFADQSHMSRQFKRAYGRTPGAWVSALARSR